MRQGNPDNINVHNCHMSVSIYGAAIECYGRCVEISQLYDLIPIGDTFLLVPFLAKDK